MYGRKITLSHFRKPVGRGKTSYKTLLRLLGYNGSISIRTNTEHAERLIAANDHERLLLLQFL